ncbi:hypothetical protein AN643_04365 [Candidatus Epulonipiscioides saccharophilum]|nr:hypothetical protein AN643_04365 [Epulopiscium sp. SCG-B10WGA-EpuloB]
MFWLNLSNYTLEKLQNIYPNVKFYGPPYPIVKRDVKIAQNTKIGENTYIGINTKIGKNCKIMYNVSFSKDVVVGDDVFIGPNVTFLNDKYPPTSISLPAIVSNDVIIGGGSIIGPDIEIQRGAVVGMGSVVTKDVSEDIVVIGNPARYYCSRNEYNKKQEKLIRTNQSINI